MDPITHSIASITISKIGFRRKAALWVLLISSIAPDLDFLSRFWGVDLFLRYHRGITHGILALFVVPVIIGLIFGRKKGFFYYSFIAFLGYAAHLLMDLTNQYGTRILSPLDWQQYSLDLTFIIDPYITIGLLLCAVFGSINKKRASVIAAVTIVLLFAYTGGRYYLKNKTMDFLKANLEAQSYKMCPLPNDFLRWWFIAKSGNEVRAGFADLFTGRISVQEIYKISYDDPLIEKSKKERVVRNFLYFSMYPYVEVRRDDGIATVVWRELSFAIRRGDHFVAKVIFDREGRVLNSYFRF